MLPPTESAPFYLDLRWARNTNHLTLHHTRFRDAIAQLAAPMHGISKDDLEGEDVRQHRRTRQLSTAAITTLVLLALLLSLTGLSAIRNGQRAKSEAAEALHQQNLAADQRNNAERYAAEARRQQDLARQQQDLAKQQQSRAARASADAQHSEQLAKSQQRLADESAAEARRQRRLADQAATRTREQQRLAQEATNRARRMQKEAQRLAGVAEQQRRLAREAAAEAAKQQANADRQLRITVSRRLLSKAAAAAYGDPKSALRLGAAAQAVSSDAATRSQFTGVIRSMSYAGELSDVTQAVYGPDGVLAVLNKAGQISLWNVADLLKPARIAVLANSKGTKSLKFSPNGRMLGVVDAQRKATLWDVANRSRPVRLATVPIDAVNVIAFTGDGNTFITGDGSGYTNLWSIENPSRPTRISTIEGMGARISTIKGIGKYPVENLEMSPSGGLLIIDLGRFILNYDVTDPVHPISADHVPEVTGQIPSIHWETAMAISPDGSILAAAFGDNGVTLYYLNGESIPELTQRQALRDDPVVPPTMPTFDTTEQEQMKGTTGYVTSLRFSEDGNMLAAGQRDGTATMWDLRAWPPENPIATVRAPVSVESVSFDPKNGTLVTSDSSATATFWHLALPATPNRLSTLTGSDWSSMATVFSPDERTLIAAEHDGTAKTWNVTVPSRPVRGADLVLHPGPVRTVEFSPDRRRVATVAADKGTLTVADVARPARATVLTTLATPVHGLNSLAFSPDGRTLAVFYDSSTLMLWDVANLARPVLLGRLTGGSFGRTMAFSPDGRTLATGGTDLSASLWNVADRSAPVRLSTLAGYSGNGGIVLSVAFSPDGRTLARGNSDGTATLWDLTDQTQPRRLVSLAVYSYEVRSVAFSPDGQTLMTGEDKTVTLWDTANLYDPIRLATIKAGFDVTAVTFGGAGSTLAVSGWISGSLQPIALWDSAELNSLLADPAKYACAIAGRGFNADEWADLIPEIKYQRSCPA